MIFYASLALSGQQVADTSYCPEIINPAYATGTGPVVFISEASMISAQFAGPQKIPAGMNSPVAKYNYQLLLNIIHWLDGLIE
ncbi:MAG TPA: hypothetical protein PKM69_06510 [Bacteroidales bacterium]|nr:hypothetical protein [Bacteroidales bacterium]